MSRPSEPKKATAPKENTPLLPGVADDDVDGAGQNHKEVVGRVALTEEILADVDRPAGPESVEHRELGVSSVGNAEGSLTREAYEAPRRLGARPPSPRRPPDRSTPSI